MFFDSLISVVCSRRFKGKAGLEALRYQGGGANLCPVAQSLVSGERFQTRTNIQGQSVLIPGAGPALRVNGISVKYPRQLLQSFPLTSH
jgi:hypothetical protein